MQSLSRGDMGGLPELPSQDGRLFCDIVLEANAAVGRGFIVIPNLNLDRDFCYRFLMRARNLTGVADSIMMGFNGDYSFGSTAYYRNNSIFVGGYVGVRSNSPTDITINGGTGADAIIEFGVYARAGGQTVSYARCFSGLTTFTRAEYNWQRYVRDQNVTEIGFTCSNNIIAAGCRVQGKVGW